MIKRLLHSHQTEDVPVGYDELANVVVHACMTNASLSEGLAAADTELTLLV